MRYETATGLYWMSVRAYDPTLGRFLQPDPMGLVPFMWVDQPYIYAGNNPLVYVDPTGLERSTGGGGGGGPSAQQISDAKNEAVNAAAIFLAAAFIPGGLQWFLSVSYGKALRDVLIAVAKRFLKTAAKNVAKFSSSAVMTAALLNLVVAVVFGLQALQGNRYWSDSSQVDNVYGWIKTIVVTATLVLLLTAVVSTIAAWELAWTWWGAVVGLISAVPTTWRLARFYVHREERDLGYPLT